MNHIIGAIMPLNLRTVIICISILSFVLVILQIVELFRFHNYGKVPKNEKVDCKECIWRHEVKSGNSVAVPHCIRPAILAKDAICRGQCKDMRYQNIPQYPKSLMTFGLEAILAVINFGIIVVTFILNIMA